MLNGSNEGAERRDWEHPRLVSLTASSETGNGTVPWSPESSVLTWITSTYGTRITTAHGSSS